MFVDPNAPVPPNRGGVPGRSVNDLQPMQTITDPGMQSAQQADAYAKFNNTAQYMPPPVMRKEGNQASEKKQERKEYNMKMKASKEQAKRDRASGNETSGTYGDNAGALYGEF